MRTTDTIPTDVPAGDAVVRRPARRVLPRLAVAGVAAALAGGGVAAVTAETAPTQPHAYAMAWPAKWVGSCC